MVLGKKEVAIMIGNINGAKIRPLEKKKTVKTLMKCSIMQHFISVYTVC